MATRTLLLLVACLAFSLHASARMEYPKTFAERALSRIKTPSVTSALTEQNASSYPVSLVEPVTLPNPNPWNQPAGPRYGYGRKKTHFPPPVSTVFFIVGGALIIAGIVFAGHPDNDDDYVDVNTGIGTICAVLGGLCLLTGLILMFVLS